MTQTDNNQWHTQNMRYLMDGVKNMRNKLEQAAGRSDPPGVPEEMDDYQTSPPAFTTLCSIFNLSSFEKEIMLLCVGMELDPEFPGLCAAVNGSANRNYPTFQMALTLLAQPHMSVLSPAHPLRYWKLIEVGGGQELTRCPLRLDEKVLDYLLGIDHIDQRLTPLLEPPPAMGKLAPSQYTIAAGMVEIWRVPTGGNHPVFALYGNHSGYKRAVAAEVAGMLGLEIEIMPAHLVPTSYKDLETLSRLWQREALLSGKILLLDCDDFDPGNSNGQRAIDHLVECTGGLIIISSHKRRSPLHRPCLNFDIEKPTVEEQRMLWKTALGDRAREMESWIERLVFQFNLDPTAIHSACLTAFSAQDPSAVSLEDRLWDNCRKLARPRLNGLVRRIEPKAGWEALVLPETQLNILKDIVTHVRHRARVYETWEFAAQGSRGLGIAALFAGTSGTGKTLAAEVLAKELKLDLFHIDLSTVIDKYIGETEKNLRQIFDHAEEAGAILLFDEADALFGKRSQVKDSHDRYANIGVSYLLQRMESYHGLAVLTSNFKDSLDKAFLRRLRFVVEFPFPGPEERAEIWNRVFPAAAPTRDLDILKLARLNISGGHIRNIALNAAFLAAGENSEVMMPHLRQAVRKEYGKLEKNLTLEASKGLD